MPTDALRNTIALAKLQELKHCYLATMIDQLMLNNIHPAIQLPKDNAAACLTEFITTYIELVPEFIDAIRALSSKLNIHRYTESFLTIAEDYFLKPAEMSTKRAGLLYLLNEAYLAHRLIEEYNDYFMSKTSIPLTPIDMAMANLIIHNLIGEPFANELDEAVNFTTEKISSHQTIFYQAELTEHINQYKQDHSEQEAHWPCLTEQLQIQLKFVHK